MKRNGKHEELPGNRRHKLSGTPVTPRVLASFVDNHCLPVQKNLVYSKFSPKFMTDLCYNVHNCLHLLKTRSTRLNAEVNLRCKDSEGAKLASMVIGLTFRG